MLESVFSLATWPQQKNVRSSAALGRLGWQIWDRRGPDVNFGLRRDHLRNLQMAMAAMDLRKNLGSFHPKSAIKCLCEPQNQLKILRSLCTPRLEWVGQFAIDKIWISFYRYLYIINIYIYMYDFTSLDSGLGRQPHPQPPAGTKARQGPRRNAAAGPPLWSTSGSPASTGGRPGHPRHPVENVENVSIKWWNSTKGAGNKSGFHEFLRFQHRLKTTFEHLGFSMMSPIPGLRLFAQCRDFVPSCFWREGPLPAVQWGYTLNRDLAILATQVFDASWLTAVGMNLTWATPYSQTSKSKLSRFDEVCFSPGTSRGMALPTQWQPKQNRAEQNGISKICANPFHGFLESAGTLRIHTVQTG